MATIKTTRLSKKAIEALQRLHSSDPTNFFFTVQKFSFPTEKIGLIAKVTGCRRAAEYSLSDDCEIKLLYVVENDTVKVFGETDRGKLFTLTLTEFEARQAIVSSELAKADGGSYLRVCGDEVYQDRIYNLYDFVEGDAGFEVIEVADAILTGYLLEGKNAANLFGSVSSKKKIKSIKRQIAA